MTHHVDGKRYHHDPRTSEPRGKPLFPVRKHWQQATHHEWRSPIPRIHSPTFRTSVGKAMATRVHFANPSSSKRRRRTLRVDNINHRSTPTLPSRSNSARLLPFTTTVSGKWLLQDSEIPVMIRNNLELIDIHATPTEPTPRHPQPLSRRRDLVVQVDQLPSPPPLQDRLHSLSKRGQNDFSSIYTRPVLPSNRCRFLGQLRP